MSVIIVLLKRLDEELEAAAASFYMEHPRRAAGTECTSCWPHFSKITLQHSFSEIHVQISCLFSLDWPRFNKRHE